MADRFPPLGAPVAGVEGSLYINSNFYPAASWQWQMVSGNIELPTTSSGTYVDQQPMLRKCLFAARGTVHANFNPFSLGVGNSPFLNSYVTVRCKVNGLMTAYCETLLVTKWDWSDEADGRAEWAIEGVGSWKFTNFNQTFL